MNFTGYSDRLNYMTEEDFQKDGYVDIGRFITRPKTEKEKLQSKVDHLEKKIELLRKEVSIRDQEISILQTKLDEVNSRWYNKLYAFITTLSIRSPFYNR
tara:strand:+ start:212 stop:511 length:300 start_codon:yes stop_codon:yes gene_type:complete